MAEIFCSSPRCFCPREDLQRALRDSRAAINQRGLSYDFNDFLVIGFAPFGQSGDRKQLFRAGVWFATLLASRPRRRKSRSRQSN